MTNNNKKMSRQTMSRSNGFTAIELLITLFIAAIFLASGFQLYSVVMKSGGETRVQANASNIMYEYLQRYKNTTSDLCTAQTPLTDQAVTVVGSASSTVTVAITCPYGITSPISKVTVSVKYGNPQQTVSEATFIKPQSIVNDGLIMNLDAGNIKSLKGRRSIINWDSWTVSAGGVAGYTVNGDGNSRVVDTNPWGVSDVVWDVSNQDSASDADGGWNGDFFTIDSTKMYRFSTWVRRKTIGNGYFFLGTGAGGAYVLNRSDNVVNSNPYFTALPWWGNANQWYLSVGYVWPAGSGTGASMPDSGIYAMDGTKITSNVDYVWQATTTSSVHRSYLYYSTDTATNQQWYQPRVDLIDGSEPSFNELMNNTGNTWTDLSSNLYNGTLYRGVNYSNTNNGVLNFDGSTGKITVNNNAALLPSNITVMAWCNAISGDTIIQKDWGTGWNLIYQGGKAVFSITDQINNKKATSTTTIVGTGWHFVVGTFDGTSVKIYVDSNMEQSVNIAGTVTTGSSAVYIGSNNYGGFSNISIGNVAIYSRILSSSEVKQNFDALRGRYGI